MHPSATIVVPCYNEGERLKAEKFISYVKAEKAIRFLFVNDGSNDNTLEILKKIEVTAPKSVTHISLPNNQGKAEAVRQGILAALQDPRVYIGYWDADLATPLAEITRFREILSVNSKIKMIFGTRKKHPGNDIERRLYRHYTGRLIAATINNILQFPIYDTQCGAKLFDRQLAARLFSQPFISRWLFDVELFARIIEGYGRDKAKDMLYELPLMKWQDIGESKIKLSYLPRIPYELGRIYLRYRNGGKG